MRVTTDSGPIYASAVNLMNVTEQVRPKPITARPITAWFTVQVDLVEIGCVLPAQDPLTGEEIVLGFGIFNASTIDVSIVQYSTGQDRTDTAICQTAPFA